MEAKTIWLIILIMTVVFFVPFYPFKVLKKFILFIFNRFVPLPIKFDDIGGIPIIGMRLFKVRIQLGAAGSLEAEEMHVKLRFLRMLAGRRPQFNPLTLYRPKIFLKQAKQKGDVWFLFPLTAMKQVVGVFFSSLTGLNVVRIYGGTITIEGKRGNTVIKDFNGEITSHGQNMKLKRLSCTVGDGSIEIKYPPNDPREGRVIVRNLRLEELTALKVPKLLTGPVNIEAVMWGPVSDLEMKGSINSPCLYMRTEQIVNFRSPLTFKGTQLSLDKMSGHIGEYKLAGTLVTDVETDISDLRLLGGGKGQAAGSILRMLNMAPFISRSGLDADIRLWGDLNEFYDFHGDIKLNMWDTEIDFSQVGTGTMAGFPLQPIPKAFLHLKLDNGILEFSECTLNSGTLRVGVNGKINMNFDVELDKVVRSQFELAFDGDCTDAKDLAGAFGMRSMNVEGSVVANFSMYADYDDHFHKLEGDGRITLENARVRSLPVNSMLSLEGLLDVKFDKIDGEVYLEKEGMGFRNLECAAGWLDVAASGFLGFFTKEIQIDGDIATVPGVVARSRVFKHIPGMENIAKKMRTSFEVKGKTGKPKISIKIADTVRSFFGGEVHHEVNDHHRAIRASEDTDSTTES